MILDCLNKETDVDKMMNRISEVSKSTGTTISVYPPETPYELFSQIERKFDSLNHDIMRLKNLLFPNYSGNTIANDNCK